ncbi:Nn.00g061040.m01.CDS01 [Neocucurbitaria sp. VM-36]
MPLEALAAVGLASNVVQLFDFLCKIYAELGEIRKSATGLSDANAELENVANNLKRLTAHLASVNAPVGSHVGQQLKDLAVSITVVADQLLDAIAEFKTHEARGKWKSFVHTWQQRLGNATKIDKMAGKLGRLQEQLNTYLLQMMRDESSDVFHEIQNLIDESKRMETNTTEELRRLKSEVLSQIRSLDTKSVLYASKVEDVLKHIERLQSVNERDVAELSGRMQKLTHTLSKIQDESRSVYQDQRILRSLHFKTIKMRESKIPEAHTKTFEWIYSENNEDSSFLEWLQRDGGVFWAMGKAGSGKSTLMKFLANHPLTRKHLRRWAAEKKLVIAKYYFWNAGNDLQKSQEGLLRSLLFTILQKCPQLISKLFEFYPDLVYFEGDLDIWNPQSLLKLFNQLSQQAESSTKFCFFIDGLDEYEGESIELIEALRALAKSTMVKLCVSSRPWHVFKDEYERPNSRSLKLEDLTRDDIALYVKDILERHERFDALQQRDIRYQELVQQIVDKAEGVFLWVFLVVQSLLRGLTSSDRISDLQRRIALLPPSLEDFFRHMLDSIEEVYRKDTFEAFQYVLHAPPSGPIPLIVFSYLDEEDPNFPFQINCAGLSQKDVELREDDMRRRLDGRTKGLLEASSRRDASDVPTVDFLHRTARDFMVTRDMRVMLDKHLDPNFNANEALARAFLAQMKLGPVPNLHSLAVDPLHTVLYYAHEIESRTYQPASRIVDDVEIVVNNNYWEATIRKDGSFLGHLVGNNLLIYVSQRLATCSSVQTSSNIPLLHVALRNVPSNATHSSQQYLNADMVELLLNKGAKPNQNLRFSATVWTEFVAAIYHYPSQYWKDGPTMLRTLELLISHGADLDIPVQIAELSKKSGLDSESYLTASEIIQQRFPGNADWLLSKTPRGTSFSGTFLAWPFFKKSSR